MAYHEQHERYCPNCGERISATAPRCFNCGEYVDEPGGEDDEITFTTQLMDTLRANRGKVVGLLALAAAVGFGVYLYLDNRKQPDPDPDHAEHLHRMIGEMAGRDDLNAASPMVLDDVKPRLRVGMPMAEVLQIISEKNAGPEASTLIGTLPLPDALEPADEEKPGPQAYILYLKDGNLTVRTDAEGNVVSWKSEALR